MDIAIIGAGNIGGTLGRHWVLAGHHVFFGVRRPGALAGLLTELGPLARAGSPAEAIRGASVIVFAAPYGAWPEFARIHLEALRGKTVIDAANPYAARDGAVVEAVAHTGYGSGVYTAHLLPGVHVVKAFNTMFWVDLLSKAHQQVERLAMPMAGEAGPAMDTVAQLAREAGFDPVRIGGLARSSDLDPGSPVYAKSMTTAQVRATLGIAA